MSCTKTIYFIHISFKLCSIHMQINCKSVFLVCIVLFIGCTLFLFRGYWIWVHLGLKHQGSYIVFQGFWDHRPPSFHLLSNQLLSNIPISHSVLLYCHMNLMYLLTHSALFLSAIELWYLNIFMLSFTCAFLVLGEHLLSNNLNNFQCQLCDLLVTNLDQTEIF